MQFALSEIGGSKSKNLIIFFFFNKDISITTLDIALKFCMTVLHIYSEVSVSQIFLFRPQFSFDVIWKIIF